MTVLRFLAPIATALLFVSAGRAETYPDCEKYDAPLAYNQCLASHGPSAAHALAARTEEGDGADFHAPQASRAFRSLRRDHGRVSATFTVDDARPAYQHGGFRHRR
jgi:hypothetical protein